MEIFKALEKKENEIILESSVQLQKLYSTLENDENFILQWYEEENKVSEILIATNISSKIKNGEMKLTSVEAK